MAKPEITNFQPGGHSADKCSIKSTPVIRDSRPSHGAADEQGDGSKHLWTAQSSTEESCFVLSCN